MEEVVAEFGTVGEATHPVRLDGCMGSRWECDVGLDMYHIVQEGHDVKKVTLRFSNEDNNIVEGQRVVEQEHDIVFERVQHPIGKVLLVPTQLFPFIVAVGHDLMQRRNSCSIFLLQFADEKGRVR